MYGQLYWLHFFTQIKHFIHVRKGNLSEFTKYTFTIKAKL